MIVLPPAKLHAEEKPYISFSAGGSFPAAQSCIPLLELKITPVKNLFAKSLTLN